MSDRIDCFTSLTDAYITGFERGKDAMRSEFEGRIKDLRAEVATLREALMDTRVKALNEGFNIAILFNGMRRSEIAQAFERAKTAALKEKGE